LTPLFFARLIFAEAIMLHTYRHQWPPVAKPCAIEQLIAKKPIGKMTADEYLVLARQAQMTLQEASAKLTKLTRGRSA
jgi:hypothetical protein